MAAGSRTKKQDEKWVYVPAIMLSCTVTKQHMQAYNPISEILTKEHCRNKHSFVQENALYLEVVETETARADKRSKYPIVDFCIGIRKGKSRKIRLVEAKFDVDNLKNIGSSNIPEKVKHSNDILISDEISIESGAVILINSGPIVQQQKRRLSDILRAKGEHYSVKTVDEFYNDYFKVS